VAERALQANARTVRRVLLATGRERARHVPDIVQIESTNLCNAKCVFCPRDEMHRQQGVMDMALFQKIVDECAALGVTHVRVHNYGEPFLDRQLVEKVRYAKSKGVYILFNTGRNVSKRRQTIVQLKRAGYPVDGLCAHYTGESLAYSKQRCRRSFVNNGFHLIANIGNRRTDFIGGSYQRAYRLPNYGNRLA